MVERTYVSPLKSAALFRDLADEWLAGKAARKAKTVAGYRSLLDALILPRWGDVKLSDITHGELQKWVSGLSVNGSTKTQGKGLSPSRVIQTHQCLSAVLKYAIRTDRLARNVADGIELPRKGESERRYLTHSELQTLAANTGRFETLTLVLGYSGLRFGEAVALRGRDVKDNKIAVRTSVTNVTGQGLTEDTTKTNKARWVPVPGFVRERLEAELPVEPDALVFPGKDGGWLTTGEYQWQFDSAATQTGVGGLVPHELRHTCASLAISAGANVKALQTLLGHASAVMTLDRYGHLFSDDLDQVAGQIDTAGKHALKTTAV